MFSSVTVRPEGIGLPGYPLGYEGHKTEFHAAIVILSYYL